MSDQGSTNTGGSPVYDSRLNDLFSTAWEAENYGEAYRYATLMVEQASSSVRAWTRKGLCAGHLSTPDAPRIREMLVCLKKASSLASANDDHAYITDRAVRVSYIVNLFWIRLNNAFNEQQQFHIDVNRQRVTVLPQRSISDSIGAGLGAGVAETMSRNAEQSKAAQKLGAVFSAQYQDLIAEGLEYAWIMDNASQVLAKNITITVSNVMEAGCIDRSAKLAFRQRIQLLLDQMRGVFPDLIQGVAPVPDEPKGCGCSPCFIAPAAAGDFNHPDVVALRYYRDLKLDTSFLGRIFIRTYYRCSPPVARVVGRSDMLRRITYRILIHPMAILARNSLARSYCMESIFSRHYREGDTVG